MSVSLTYSLILPCLNEEENIEATVWDAAHWLSTEKLDGTIIVVNDGSTDGTAAILEKLQRELTNLQVVTHPKKSGYGLAVRSGCDAAATDIIAFMDSDGQFKAKELSLLLPSMQTYAFVTGRRRYRADPFMRRVFGKILGLMNFLFFGIWIRDVNCGLKMFTREVWPRIRPTHAVEKLFNTEMFIRLKRQKILWLAVPVPHYPRLHGKPTGGSPSVILLMFKELWDLKRLL
ncbi:MAG: cell wall biosynthesis glycosyltransferase [Candidatus Peribacteria bacterium]|nr:cell wall biosynthesis glycosyltransferase [Candidatus Peribacteria bacterium]